MAKKTNETTKKAWTASDFLENRKKRVENASSYTKPRGETASQINTRNIVSTAGQDYNAQREREIEETRNLSLDEYLKKRQSRASKVAQYTTQSDLSTDRLRQPSLFRDYMVPLAERQKEQEKAERPKTNIYNQGRVSDKAMEQIRNYTDNGQRLNNLTPEEAVEQRNNIQNEKSLRKLYEIAKNSLNPNTLQSLIPSLMNEYQKDTRYNGNPYEKESLQPTDNAGDRISYSKAARQDPKNPLNMALSEARKLAPGTELPESIRSYTSMTPMEKQRYYELYGEYGVERAEEFKRSLTDSVNYRMAKENYDNNKMLHNPVGRVGGSFVSGIKNFSEGIDNNINWILGSDQKKANTVNQYEQSIYRDRSTGDVENVAQDLAQTAGMMAPSAAIGQFTGNTTIADALFGLSIGGNAYQQTINEGYGEGQAGVYASQQAIDEWATNVVLNGVGGFGGGMLQKLLRNTKVAQAAVQGLEKLVKTPLTAALVKSGLNLILDAGGEFTQEFVQNYTDKITRNLILGEDNEITLSDPEAWYSAALGALNSIVMNTASAPVNVAAQNYQLDQIRNTYGNEISMYKDIAKSAEPNSLIARLAEDYVNRLENDKNVGSIRRAVFGNLMDESLEGLRERKLEREDESNIDTSNDFIDVPDGETIIEPDHDIASQAIPGIVAENTTTQSDVRDTVNAAVNELQRQQEEIQDTSESTPEEAKIQTETLVNAIRQDVSQETEIKNELQKPKAEIYDTENDVLASEIAENLRNNTQNGENLTETGNRFTGPVTSDAINAAMDEYLRANNIVEDEDLKSIKDTLRPAYGVSGQSVYNNLVRANENFSDDTKAFNRLYNAGRYGLKYSEAGDTSRFGAVSEAAYRAGIKDRSAEFAELKKSSDQFIKNPTGVKRGVYINATRGENKAIDKAFKNFTKFVPFSIVVVDSRDKMSLASALSQLKKNGLEDMNATVESVFNYRASGTSDAKRGFIVIDINTDNILNTVGHELTHIAKIYNPKGYKVYRDAVLRKLSKTSGYNLENKIAYMQDEYRKTFKQELSREQAEEELVAEAADFLNDKEIIREVIEKDRSFAEKIRDWIRSAADMLKKLMDASTSREEARVLRSNYETYRDAAKLWTEMLEGAADNYNKALENSKALKANAEVESMIRNQLDLSEGMGHKVIVPGNPMSAEEIFSDDEAMWDKADEYNNATEKAWKNIIEAEDFASLGFPQDKNRYYTLTPSSRTENAYQLTYFDEKGAIGHSEYKTDDLKRLYSDLLGYTPGEGLEVTVMDAKDMIESLPEQTKFQIDKPIEKTKDLIAIHNLSMDNLLKSLEMGGFPSPSIAIIKDSMLHDKYGDCSVYFYRDTIDPKANRKNKAYGGDAWTPTYPPVQYKISEKKLNELKKIVDALPAELRSSGLGGTSLDVDNATDLINRFKGDAVKAYKDKIQLKYAFITANDGLGMTVLELPKQPGGNEGIDRKIIEAVARAIPDEAFDKGYHNVDRKYIGPVRDAANAANYEIYQEKLKDYEGKSKERRLEESKHRFEMYVGEFDKFMRIVWKYKQNNNQLPMVLDEGATKEWINEQLKGHEEEYHDWLRKKFDGIIEKEGIRNEKDVFTRSGNRRSWETLHDEVTLDNLVKAMNLEDAKGGTMLGTNIMALATKDFKSVDEIHAAEYQLQQMSDEEHKKLKDEYFDRYSEITSEIRPKHSTSMYVDITGIIADALRSKKTVKGIDAELRKYLNIQDDTAQRLVDLMKDLAEMPYGYFEAKPQRAVYNNEIAGVLIPDTAKQELIDALNSRNIRSIQYKANDGADRKAEQDVLLEEKPEIRFQAAMANPKAVNQKNFENNIYNVRSMDAIPVNETLVLVDPETQKETIVSFDKIDNYTQNERRAYIRGLFRKYGTVYNKDIGEINLVNKSVLDESGHKTFPEPRYIALNNLPTLIKNSLPVYYDRNHKENNWDTITLASKMKTPSDGKEYYVLATIKITKDNNTYRFSFTNENDVDVAEINGKDNKSIRLLSPSPMLIHNGLERITDALTNNTLFEYLKGVNTTNNKNSENIEESSEKNNLRFQFNSQGDKLSEEQAEYFADSQVRDADGNLMVMYHGTPNGSFNTFRNGINFFTPNKEYASWYESPSQSSRTAGKTAEAPRTYEVYLNMAHPFDIRNAEDRKAFIDDYVKGGWALGIDPYVPYKDTTKTGLPSWEEADNIYEWMEENDLLDKYDGILVDEGGTESGFDRGVSYVTFKPNQVKNIDNENPTDSDDIRYQLNIPSEMFYDPDAEDERLKTANAYLTNMLQASKNLTPSEKDIKKVVKDITETYNSSMDRKELTRQLTELYTYMRTNEHVDGAQVSDTINAIARQVIREAKFTDPQQQEMYDKFRKEMRETTLYVDKNYVNDIEPEGWNTLRKKYFGRIKLTANPEMSNHDGIRTYLQLQQDFPEIFRTSVDDIMTDADAIREILYGFETARPKERSVFGEASSESEAAEELATRIMDAYFEVGNESVKNEYLKTYKQVREDIREEIIREYNNSLKSIQIDDAKKLSSLVKNYKAGEITANSLFVTKEALTDYTRQQNDAARELFMNKRDKYVDRIQRNKYKDDIIKTSKELAKMILSPTDKKHIPTDMVGPISNVLQYIDFSSNRVNPDGSLPNRTVESDEFHKSITGIIGILNRLDKNNSVYENNGETSYLVIDPDLMQNLREVSEAFAGNDAVKDNVDNLSTQNLRTVAQTLKALKQMVNNANKFISAGRYESVSELAKQSIDDFNYHANRVSASKLATKAKEIAQNKYIGMMDDLLNSGMLDAYTFFDSWGDTGHVLYDDVRTGLDRKIRNTRTAVDFMEESMKRNNVSVKERNRWDNDLIEVELNAQDESHEIKTNMTAAQIMSLYLLNKRGQARMHLYGDHLSHNRQNGGFILEASGRNKAKMDTKHVFKVTEQDVEALISKLTPKQKAVADDIGRFLTEVTSKWGNEVTQRLYGYNKFEAKNYFPIKVDNTTIGKTSQSLERGMTMLKNIGQTKSVQQRAYNPLTLQNIFDVYAAQADDMGSYNAFVTSSADLQMWLNYKGDEGNVQRALKNAYGDKANEYFMNILRDINGSRGDPSKWDKALGSLVHLQRGGAIWGNLRVAVQQPFAYIRAADTMKIKYLLQGLTLSPMQQAKEWELCKEYAPIAQWKDYGFFDIEVGPSMKRLILGNDTLKDKVADAGMWAASTGDMIAWVRLWYASQAEVKDTHPELTPGTKEFYEEAGKVFSHVIDTTQVVDSVLHRTDIMKDKSTSVKNAAAFLSEPSKTYNMLYRAARDFALSNNKAAAGKRLAATTTVWLVAQAVNSAVASFISALRYHDKDKDLLEKYKEKFIADYLDSLQLWGSIPIIKQWFSAFSGEDQDTDATYSLLKLIPDMYFELMKAKDGKQKKGWWALLYQASQLTSFWGGNNLQNPLRDIDGIIDNLIIRDDMGMYYPYQQARYDMYAQQDNGSYPNLSRFVSTAMKAYAQGDSELGDKIIADLKAEIPEDKVVNQITSRLVKEPELEELAQATLDGDKETAETLTASLKAKGYPEELIEKKVESVAKGLKPSSEDMARGFVDKPEGWQDQLRKFENYYHSHGKTEDEIRTLLKNGVTKAYADEYKSLDGKGQKTLQTKLLGLKYKGQALYKEGDFVKKNSPWKK